MFPVRMITKPDIVSKPVQGNHFSARHRWVHVLQISYDLCVFVDVFIYSTKIQTQMGTYVTVFNRNVCICRSIYLFDKIQAQGSICFTDFILVVYLYSHLLIYQYYRHEMIDILQSIPLQMRRHTYFIVYIRFMYLQRYLCNRQKLLIIF